MMLLKKRQPVGARTALHKVQKRNKEELYEYSADETGIQVERRMITMKKTRCMILLLAAVWASLLLGNTVMAETKFKVNDIKPDTTVNLKDRHELETSYETHDDKTGETAYTYVYNEYRLVIPADGYIKIKMGGKNDYNGIHGYKHPKAYYYANNKSGDFIQIPLFFTLEMEDIENGRDIIPLSKGTYYFDAYCISNNAADTMPFSYSFKKASFPANYCRAKAQTLKRGKKAEICQIPKKNYNRWFKIKLTKKQAITFWSDNGDHAAIFNEDLERIEIKRAGEKSIKYSTVKKLPKGTYYLRMARCSSHIYPDDENSCYTTLYWK